MRFGAMLESAGILSIKAACIMEYVIKEAGAMVGALVNHYEVSRPEIVVE